jgi:hypothetical protein
LKKKKKRGAGAGAGAGAAGGHQCVCGEQLVVVLLLVIWDLR